MGIATLVVVWNDRTPVAFMGIEGKKIGMLFVAPDCFGRGLGRELTELAIVQYGVCYVDVNEQNPQAAGFYRRIGFEVYERTEKDEQGNPFPILKMRLCGK